MFGTTKFSKEKTNIYLNTTQDRSTNSYYCLSSWVQTKSRCIFPSHSFCISICMPVCLSVCLPMLFIESFKTFIGEAERGEERNEMRFHFGFGN